MTRANNKEQVFDENLYSRQIYVLGVDAMKRLASSSVLISGMGGLGVEIAKNIILAGVQNVTIHDTRQTEMSDLASNFYLTEKSIGKNRATESLSQLISLNEYVSVNAKTEELNNDFLMNYQCVVITDYHSESEIKQISSFCHHNNIKLILTETRGVFAYIFNDFGTNFVVTDPTGEPPSRFLLSFVTNSKNGVITIAGGEHHNLSDGDHVTFEEVEGMTELNGKEFTVKVISARQFSIGDTTSFGKYSSNYRSGYGNQIIIPTKYDFLEFTEALKNQETMQIPFDYCTFGQDQQVILAFIAAQHYMDKINKKTPEVSGDDLLESAKEVNETYKIVEEIDEKLIREFARESGAVICPTCATFGGIAGQEVIKSISGKFGPIHQFLAMGYTSSLPTEIHCELKNDRYDPYRIVFGNKQQEVIENLRYFMIGAGALGCEQLKNWALMGVATQEKSHIYVTDMDSIERSNLNRQFLFRNKDIGKMKSDVAAETVRIMNSSIKIESQQNKIGEDTRNIYIDEFYDQLDGVCNALDNVETRIFSDKMCVFYNKPLLESGTLGTKAHYQIVIPHLTESYGSQSDADENGFPSCTIRNFPSNIAHCTIWGRDKFCGIFEMEPQLVSTLLNDPNYIEKMKKSDQLQLGTMLRSAKEYFIDEKCENFNDCIKWARFKFENLFNFNIRDIQHQFPLDSTDQGLPFWTGNKRFPRPATFDPNNKYHAEFVITAATMRARICGIKQEKVDIPNLAAQVQVNEWTPSNKKIDLSEEPKEELIDYDDIESLIKLITPFIEKGCKNPPKPEHFEKDDDSNGHIDFIDAAANIRAFNYFIEPKDKLEIKRIAGNIIPAIATTTAMICGLVALEMYKVHNYKHEKKIEDFRFGSINLAIPTFNLCQPVPCIYKECPANHLKYSLWEKWLIEGDLTLNEFIKEVTNKYNVIPDMLTACSYMIYPSKQSLLNDKISETLIKMGNKPLSKGQYYIEVIALCSDKDGEDIYTPPFILKVK